MFKAEFIVKEIGDSGVFYNGSIQVPKIEGVFAYPDKANTVVKITFYSQDKVNDVITLIPGDTVEIGFTIKSTKSSKNFWGTYLTGIFITKKSNAGDVPEEYINYKENVESFENNSKQGVEDFLGTDVKINVEPDDLPF